MPSNDIRILIVAEDSDVTAHIATTLVVGLSADITLVDTFAEAIALVASEVYDVVITADVLDDGLAVHLLAGEYETTRTPIIVIANDPTIDEVLHAVRRGAIDVLCQPINCDRLIRVVRRTVEQRRHDDRESTRSRRLRSLSSKLVRDRRELRSRVDLICRDVVLAYRRLAEKYVTGTPDSASEKHKPVESTSASN